MDANLHRHDEYRIVQHEINALVTTAFTFAFTLNSTYTTGIDEGKKLFRSDKTHSGSVQVVKKKKLAVPFFFTENSSRRELSRTAPGHASM